MLGIGQTITLSITPVGTSVYDMLWVYRNSSATTVGATKTSLSPTTTATFTVDPNQYVAFEYQWTYGLGQFTIKNVDNGNSTVDVIVFDNT